MEGMDWTLILNHAKDILSGLLMVLGGLAVIARYTKWAWDARLFSILEQVVKSLIMIIPFLLTLVPLLKKKEKSDGNKNNSSN